MILTLTIIIAAYCLFLLSLIYGWHKLTGKKEAGRKKADQFSILIPVRNEEEKIATIFKSLQQQDFPAGGAEIIFINDHSDDRTVEELERLMPFARFSTRLINLKKGTGKKAALQYGIASAAGSVIITTDADCSMSSNWLKSICSFYQRSDAEMLFGPVTFKEENTIFKKLQTIEFASLSGTGAASLSLGKPNMCNGANLSFRKNAFFAVGGYSGNDHIASGDDEFLMHKFCLKFPGKVFFNKSPDAIVYTQAHPAWSAFFQQRKRWASKWRLYSNPETIFLAIFVFLLNMSMIIAVGLLVTAYSAHQWLLLPIVAKLALEVFFLSSVLRFLGKKLDPFLLLILQFTYPFYVILFGIAANFGTYTWKGRKL